MIYTHFFSVMGHAPCGKNTRTAHGTVLFSEVSCPACLRALAYRAGPIGDYARAALAEAAS